MNSSAVTAHEPQSDRCAPALDSSLTNSLCAVIGQQRRILSDMNAPGCLAGNAQDHAGTTASAAAARQPSDSDQTQDSQPEAQQEVQQPAAPAPEEPAGVTSPARQGRRGRGPAPADQGMYTGAFAFPDSASLGMSQPELDLPVLRGSKLPAAAATQGKASGKAAAASNTGAISRAPAASAGVPEKAAAGKKAVPAKSHEGKAAARVVPSAWKAKKADPVVDQPVETTKTGWHSLLQQIAFSTKSLYFIYEVNATAWKSLDDDCQWQACCLICT